MAGRASLAGPSVSACAHVLTYTFSVRMYVCVHSTMCLDCLYIQTYVYPQLRMC